MATYSKKEQRVIGIWAKHDKIGFRNAYQRLTLVKKEWGDNKSGYSEYLRMEIDRYKEDIRWKQHHVRLVEEYYGS